MWGDLNHTVLELFILILRMKNYEVINILKKFINPNVLMKLQLKDYQRYEKKDNTNKSEKILNIPKTPDNFISNENNESSIEVKIKSKVHHLVPQVSNFQSFFWEYVISVNLLDDS